MSTPKFVQTSLNTLKSNAPQILTAFGVTGVVTTAYLSGKAAIKAHIKIKDENAEDESLRERAKLVWTFYIPPVVAGGTTITCIVFASKISAKRAAAAVAAYSITTKAFDEYRDKIAEEFGKGKEQRIRDDLVQRHISDNPPKEVIVTGSGEVLCCDMYTRRYFKSDMVTLRKAENQINKRIFNEMEVTLDEFYDMIGLPHTSESGSMGWTSDRLMELEFTTTLSEDDIPCLAFVYNYLKVLW